MFFHSANRLLEDAGHKEPGHQTFRRHLTLSTTDDGQTILANINYGGRACDGVSIAYEEWTKIRAASDNMGGSSYMRNFLLYCHLKDRGLLKEWFDKARSVGINTKFYMKGNYA